VCYVSVQIQLEDSRYDHLTKMSGVGGGGGGHGHSQSKGSNNNNGKSHNITCPFSKENWERVVNLMFAGDG
jgi:hypothetical protein